MKYYKIYFGTEESCFEPWKVGQYKTLEKTKSELKKTIRDEFENEEDEDYISILNEIDNMRENYDVFAFNNSHNYMIVVIATTDGRKAISELNDYRRVYF